MDSFTETTIKLCTKNNSRFGEKWLWEQWGWHVRGRPRRQAVVVPSTRHTTVYPTNIGLLYKILYSSSLFCFGNLLKNPDTYFSNNDDVISV